MYSVLVKYEIDVLLAKVAIYIYSSVTSSKCAPIQAVMERVFCLFESRDLWKMKLGFVLE